MPVIEHIPYEQFELDCRRLANIIHKAGTPKRLVAITRGGMVPTCLLAQFLDIREIHTISLSSYDEANKVGEIKEHVFPNVIDDAETLFVDDLIDSGRVHEYIKKRFPKSKIAVVYSKNDKNHSDFPSVNKDPETWLSFPWEHNPINV